MYDVVVIGGGASGMCAAISASETLKNGKVAVVEKNNRVGKKILITGNGRCNITNKDISVSNYHSDDISFVEHVLDKFNLGDTEKFFNKTGIMFYAEKDKLFPNSLQASSVVDMLRFRMLGNNVEEICDFNCVKLTKNKHFEIVSDTGRKIFAKTVIVCVGGAASPKCGTDGKSYSLLKSFGHKMSEIFPSLVQIKCENKKTVPLKGVKVNGNITVYVDNNPCLTKHGEILFTDYGLSGPPVFSLSRVVSKAYVDKSECYVVIDLFPLLTEKDIYNFLKDRNKELSLDMFLNGMLNKIVGREIVKLSCDYKLNLKADVLTDNDIKNIAYNIKNWKFKISGTKGWDASQVTAGGINTKLFNRCTLESLCCENLFAAGEVLNVDGDCGGFNLQWAWSSGYLAGVSAAQKLLEGKYNDCI